MLSPGMIDDKDMDGAYWGTQCAHLVWLAFFANGYDIENVRIYQEVTLPAGRYYFGASYRGFEPNDDLYILATKEIITTAEIPTKSLAYDKVINAPKDGTFRGITFELTEETSLFLGLTFAAGTGFSLLSMYSRVSWGTCFSYISISIFSRTLRGVVCSLR